MYAEIPKEVIPKKEYLLDVGKVYIIKKFKISNAKTTYKVVDKQFMIELSEFTTIELARNPPHTIPEYVYRLTPFSAIVPAERIVSTYTGKHESI
jgi:replication factor A1